MCLAWRRRLWRCLFAVRFSGTRGAFVACHQPPVPISMASRDPPCDNSPTETAAALVNLSQAHSPPRTPQRGCQRRPVKAQLRLDTPGSTQSQKKSSGTSTPMGNSPRTPIKTNLDNAPPKARRPRPKRGRPLAPLPSREQTASFAATDEEHTKWVERLAKRRRRNRESAAFNRMKKKKEFDQLRSEVVLLRQENSELRAMATRQASRLAELAVVKSALTPRIGVAQGIPAFRALASRGAGVFAHPAMAQRRPPFSAPPRQAWRQPVSVANVASLLASGGDLTNQYLAALASNLPSPSRTSPSAGTASPAWRQYNSPQ